MLFTFSLGGVAKTSTVPVPGTKIYLGRTEQTYCGLELYGPGCKVLISKTLLAVREAASHLVWSRVESLQNIRANLRIVTNKTGSRVDLQRNMPWRTTRVCPRKPIITKPVAGSLERRPADSMPYGRLRLSHCSSFTLIMTGRVACQLGAPKAKVAWARL